MTQLELADLLGVKQSFVSAIENDRKGVSKDAASILSKKLGVEVNRLFSAENGENEYTEAANQITSKNMSELTSLVDSTTKLKNAINILFEYDALLADLNEEHKVFFEAPLKKLFALEKKNKGIKDLQKEKDKNNELLIKYASFVSFIVETRKSLHHRLLKKDLSALLK